MKRFFCNGKNGFCDREIKNGYVWCKGCQFENGTGGELVEITTNFDRIMAMSLEELAKLLCELQQRDKSIGGVNAGCFECIASKYCRHGVNGMRVYLESEVTE